MVNYKLLGIMTTIVFFIALLFWLLLKPSNHPDDELKQIAKGIIATRPAKQAAFRECQKGNVNRDVVYNDTNELAETCKKYAESLYPKVNTDVFTETRINKFVLLYDSGQLKD